MKTIGIIAEYNPFHSGHSYQITTAREKLSADCVVCVMSGDFVQRGEPSIFDMHTRADIAVHNGCDLVIMLPVHYSVSASDYFAEGAVSILNAIGGIDNLVFGTETDELSELTQIADILYNEPLEFSAALKKHLSNGLSYASARENALSEYLGKDVSSIIRTPNNILAIDYLKALKLQNSSIIPYAIKRVGSGYNDAVAQGAFASATALRKQIADNNFSSITGYVDAYEFSRITDNSPVFSQDFYELIMHSLIVNKSHLEDYLDVNASIANTIRIVLSEGKISDFDSLVDKISSKNITSAKVRRILFHILLDIRKESFGKKAPYARILAFNETGREYLNSIKKTSSIPFFTNPSKAASLLDSEAIKMFEKDMDACEIYNLILSKKTGTRVVNEFRRKLF